MSHNKLLPILTIKNILATRNKFPLKQRSRFINNKRIMNFQIQLQKEIWKSVYKDKDPNHTFISFLCTFLNIFQLSFPIKYKNYEEKVIGLQKE